MTTFKYVTKTGCLSKPLTEEKAAVRAALRATYGSQLPGPDEEICVGLYVETAEGDGQWKVFRRKARVSPPPRKSSEALLPRKSSEACLVTATETAACWLLPDQSLLFRNQSIWRRMSLANVPKWTYHLKAPWWKSPQIKKRFYNRLLKLLTGDWMKARAAFSLAGRLQKRLMLKRYHFGSIAALLVTHFPHAEADARSCPAVLAAHLRSFLDRGHAAKAKDVNWLGGLKFVVKTFPKPKEVNWTPRTRNDVRVARAFHCAAESGLGESGRRKLLQTAVVRNEIRLLPKDFQVFIADGDKMARELQMWGLTAPTYDPRSPKQWHDAVLAAWRPEQEKRADEAYRQRLEAPCAGEGLLPELEHERLKFGRDLVAAGDELRHCLGSYVGYPEYVHYRRDSVVCQVYLLERRVVQCFDTCNQDTAASRAYAAEVKEHLQRERVAMNAAQSVPVS